MTSTLKRNAAIAVIALVAAGGLAGTASAKNYYKGYGWNKFAHGHHGHHRHHKHHYVESDGCGYYWKKFKWTGDNIWRGRYYACVYGGS
jgi:hypothetical protein